MVNYTILLPPSEMKIKGGDESKIFRVIQNKKESNFFISLRSDREFIYDELRKAISELNESDLEKVFELKGKKLQEAVEIMLDLLNEETMPAVNRYDGTMFKYISYNTMSESEKNNFNSSVIFIDGLFGLLKPLDLIPEYKLKISSKFSGINLSKFWKEQLKGYFEIIFRDKLVLDLLPEAHKKVLNFNSLDENLNPNPNSIISLKFYEKKDNKLMNSAHDSKRLKGELLRYIVSKNIITRDDLEKFIHTDGYKYSSKDSSKTEIIYLK